MTPTLFLPDWRPDMRATRTVTLPTKPLMRVGAAADAFRVSRETVRLWRRDKAFPLADDGLLDVQAVAVWAIRQGGWKVEWR